MKRCKKCHRPLKDPSHIELGYGPVCYKKTFGKLPRKNRITAYGISDAEVPPLFRIPPGIKFCDCKSCDFGEKCEFYNKYERLPEQYFSGAKSKCPLLKYELAIKNN